MQGIDLFCGAGGMSIGAKQAGIKICHAVELDPNAAATYVYNHRGVVLFEADIRKIKSDHFKGLKKKEPIVVFGGPPCQGFSTSNQKNRNIDNENNWLFKDYLRLVKGINPDWVVFENVKGLRETEDGYFLDQLLRGFSKLGYTTSEFILCSSDYGVPQNRNRLFIIASLHGIRVPVPKKSNKPHVTVREALEDLPPLQNGSLVDLSKYGKKSQSMYARQMRGSLEECHNNLVSYNAAHVIRRYEHIPPGGNWECVPAKLMRNYADRSRCHTGIYRRLDPDAPSVVIGNYRKNMLIHPWENRGLSVREAARLQSFPDSFRFLGSIGFQQQQVGNSVPPLLAKAMFRSIIKTM